MENYFSILFLFLLIIPGCHSLNDFHRDIHFSGTPEPAGRFLNN